MFEPATLRLLGGFELRPGARATHLPPSVQRLVALVAVRGPIGRRQAVATLWPDIDQHSAQRRMRSDLWRISSRAADLLTIGADCLRLGAQIQVDVAQLDAHARLVLRRAGQTVAIPVGAESDASVFIDLPRWPVGQHLLPGWITNG